VARDGTIWIRNLTDPEGSVAEWWQLDPTGEWAGRVHLPETASVLLANEEQLWTVEEDALEGERIVRYGIDRS
jgi:hypothetical protein